MEDLQLFLKEKNYKRIKFKVLKTQHLLVSAKINGIKGNFILDTGASNSFISTEAIEKFNLIVKISKDKAAGVGASGMEMQISTNNHLKMSYWFFNKFNIAVLNLQHVNTALQHYKMKPVDGIIGADVLLQGNGIIDYSNRVLYLK